MNANFFRYDFVNNTIIGSKTAIKRASNPASAEYKELIMMKKAQPNFAVAEKDIKKNTVKRTYRGLTIEVMKAHIEAQKDAEAKMAEFEKVRVMGYPLTKKWFLDNYKKSFTMKVIKKTAANAKVVRTVKGA